MPITLLPAVQRRAAMAALLLWASLGAGPAWAANTPPKAAQDTTPVASQAAKAAKAAKPKGAASGPGTHCNATADNKVPSWPKCPPKTKVPAKQ